MQYISPLVFSALALLDPALTALISWIAGLEHLPTVFSWIGGAVVMSGIGLISFSERKH
jgi:drug/metabolite transporter (DMT)-like permease